MAKGDFKKQKRLARQIELLKHFEGDFYQEKQIGNEWYVKSFNGGTKRWQVSIYSEDSFKRYKSYQNNKKEIEEQEEYIKDINCANDMKDCNGEMIEIK